MEMKELKDGIVLTIPDDVDYILVHHKKGSATSGISVKADGLNLMALATAMVADVLEKIKEPYLQSVFFKAMFDTVKENDSLNPVVDVAVSYYGKVLRSSNEKAADYCE